MRRIQDLLELGFTHVLLLIRPPNPVPAVELAIEEVLPEFRRRAAQVRDRSVFKK